MMIYDFDLTQIRGSFLSFLRDATGTSVCKLEKAKYGVRGCRKEMAEMRLVCHMILGLLWQLLPVVR